MADISKIALPDGSSYDLISKKTYGIFRGAVDSMSTSTAFTATISGITQLYDGLTISLKNIRVNSAARCTLNINNLGAKTIWASQLNAALTVNGFPKDSEFLFTYDYANDRWIKQQGSSTINTDTVGEYIKQDGITGATITRFGTCGVGAGTAAKTVSVTAGTFALAAGSRVTVKFTYANTANSPTLNVNSTGAKNIFHQGVQITSGENKSLLAGVVDFVYDGTQWHFIGNYLNTADGATNVVVSATQPTNQKVGDLWFVLSEDGYPTSAESETF